MGGGGKGGGRQVCFGGLDGWPRSAPRWGVHAPPPPPLAAACQWIHGYRERFGFTHVDFNTQARTVKDSGRYLSQHFFKMN